MPDDIDKLDGPELAAAVAAKVMGWKGIVNRTRWRPDEDADDAREMEDELERRRLQGDYAFQLWRDCYPKVPGGGLAVMPRDLFPVIHATCAQRCRAALRTVEAE